MRRPSLLAGLTMAAKSVFVLNVVDGCIPSDLGTGTTAEIEEASSTLRDDDSRQGRFASHRTSAIPSP
jgi:hypothetical protein